MSISNSIDIEHFPDIRAAHSSLVVDINEAVRSRLSPDTVLTREVAIDIFKSIKTSSHVAAFFLQPKLVVSLTIGASILVFAVTIVGLISLGGALGPASTGILFSSFVRLVLTLTVTTLFGCCSLSFSMWDELENLSEAYTQQGERAQRYLDLLADAVSDVRINLD